MFIFPLRSGTDSVRESQYLVHAKKIKHCRCSREDPTLLMSDASYGRVARPFSLDNFVTPLVLYLLCFFGKTNSISPCRCFAAALAKYQTRSLIVLYDTIGTLADNAGRCLAQPALLGILMPPLMQRWNQVRIKRRA